MHVLNLSMSLLSYINIYCCIKRAVAQQGSHTLHLPPASHASNHHHHESMMENYRHRQHNDTFVFFLLYIFGVGYHLLAPLPSPKPSFYDFLFISFHSDTKKTDKDLLMDVQYVGIILRWWWYPHAHRKSSFLAPILRFITVLFRFSQTCYWHLPPATVVYFCPQGDNNQ